MHRPFWIKVHALLALFCALPAAAQAMLEEYRCAGLLAGVDALSYLQRRSIDTVVSERDRRLLDEIFVFATYGGGVDTPADLLDAYAAARHAIEARVRQEEDFLRAGPELRVLYEEERSALDARLERAVAWLRDVVAKHRVLLDRQSGGGRIPASPPRKSQLAFSDPRLEALWKSASGEETRGEAQALAADAPWSRYAKTVHLRLEALAACESILEARLIGGFKKYDAVSKRLGWYSVRVDMQWRLLFRWPTGSAGPVDLRVEDYHVN